MTVRAVDVGRSRVVLIGVPRYRHADLPDLPPVADNVADLAGVLTDPAVGGFPAAHCVTARADATVPEVGELLHDAADQAEDLLLCYYSGHGKVDDRGELYLTLADTNVRHLAFSALPFGAIRDAMRTSKARNRVVILDTCYSGRATAATLSAGDDEVLAQLEVAGGYTLTSSPATSPSLVRPGERHTAFTGRLLALLREGSRHAGEVLTLRDIYRHLRARLAADGLPAPQQCGTAMADSLGLVRNPMPKPAELPADITEGLESRVPWMRLAAVGELGRWLAGADRAEAVAARTALEKVAANDNPQVAAAARALLDAAPVRTSPPLAVRATAVLDEAERLVTGSTDRNKDLALMHVAYAVATHLPERLDRALAAMSEPNDHFLVGLTKQICRTDPDRAERVARTITDMAKRAEALGSVAASVYGNDPQRAQRLFHEAELDLATAEVRSPDWSVAALAETAASCDTRWAERLAARIADIRKRLETMIAIGAAGPAVRIAGEVERDAAVLLPVRESLPVLARLAAMLVPVDPERAVSIFDDVERTALGLAPAALEWGDEVSDSRLSDFETHARLRTRARVLGDIARAASASDLDRAERIAVSITTQDDLRMGTLVYVLWKAEAADDVRVNRLMDAVERLITAPHAAYSEADLLAAVQVVAAHDPARAERLVSAATHVSTGCLLATLAIAVADADPDYALRIATGITDTGWKAYALAAVAGRLLGKAGADAEPVDPASTDRLSRESPGV
ncbi:caspase family protein [Kibdelosporangium phytohabitans]|uniref:Peptidase C14 caspase domain-containing protein n=1 Tax=Kibdelosporangium phytohabitans TaxID=860235 RepID=A0A0N7F4Q2_9PSEU|nr:caspase family protein [Kibdelosporangium phytohabitans]ALG12063.1 hypothetical protein AOZ06_38990 [Kibdelosporangium phytohabitans]MBE1463548.1 hypothetical protein [Kibdelosporangium phytohabitans]